MSKGVRESVGPFRFYGKKQRIGGVLATHNAFAKLKKLLVGE